MAFSINTPVFVSLSLIVVLNFQSLVLSTPRVPCLFFFGDSLIDNGNNNQLNTRGKANYFPYGIDFPDGPTGRFTNGRNIADFIAKFLGFETYIPPFATAQGSDILNGVNYASGFAGIRNETGEQVGDRLCIDKQLENHFVTISRITKQFANDTLAKQLLSKCVYYFVVGSNDYINNYFIPEYYSSSKTYNPEEYATVLINQYGQQLKTLYNFGARKFALSALNPLGCIPQIRKGNVTCYKEGNDAVQLFNTKLKVLVDDLNNNLADVNIVYVRALQDVVPVEVFDLASIVLDQPCCKFSNSTGLCVPGQAPCPVRALHIFYDNIHPAEVLAKVVAIISYLDVQKLIG